ncbi:hypothetical protein LCGC14_2741500 [marine sediment metagenome]|uniref:Uncharacterized protein n=1 Tax=marine sediment metagenome TaxID=412755 RepID=A0A0F8Z4A2_9ZZZZ
MGEDNQIGGYLKLWRSLGWSEFWEEMPFSHCKLWLWLLMEAAHKENAERRKLNPGQLDHSLRFMCQAVKWMDTDKHRWVTPSQPTIVKALKRLEADGCIIIFSTPRVTSVITICNWELYQSKEGEGNSSTNSSTNSKLKNPPPPTPPSTRITTVKNPSDFPPEAISILEDWKSVHALPSKTTDVACLDTLEKLHRLDGHDYKTIRTVCAHIVRAKVPKFIRSPIKLRQPTRAGDELTFEHYLLDTPDSNGSPTWHPKDRVVDSQYRAIKDNPTLRLRVILENDPTATHDPDQEKPYTLTDATIAQAKKEQSHE